STPTSNSTVATTLPGRLTEKVCSTPSISDSTCSSGYATICSTWRASAPGKGTMTLAMVTSIWGSSSRGVIASATTPSSRPSRARTGVSGLAWKAPARRPAMPGRGAADAATSPAPAHGDQRLARRHRVGGDGLARPQAGDHLDLAGRGLAQPQLAQRQPAVAEHVGGDDLATAHQCGGGDARMRGPGR